MKILVVDDNTTSADSLAESLKAPGVETEVVYNGEECLERVKKDPPVDLIILDMSMPGMNGVQVLEEFLKWNPPPEFKVIIATAFADWQSDFAERSLGGNTSWESDSPSEASKDSQNSFSKILIGELDKSSGFPALVAQIKVHIQQLQQH